MVTEDNQSISVLLVDHEPTDRVLLRRWIERSLDAEIREASNGLEALELLSTEKFELIVTELSLPQLSGIDLLTLADADPRRKQMEILVSSRNASEDVVRRAIELGISDYLLKPLQYDWAIQRLQAAAERALERRENERGESGGSLKRILVADPDANFGATVEAAVFGIYSFRQSSTVASTLVSALRFKPEAVFISKALSSLRLDFLVGRIRRLPDLKDIPIVELSHEGGAPTTDGVDGVLQFTYVPDKLRSEILRLLGDEENADEHLAWTKPFRTELGSAISQTFGMLTGDDVEIEDEAPEPDAPELFGSIHVDEAPGPISLLVEMWCSARLSAHLTGAMLGEEPSDEEAQPDVINEALNVMGGRLKHSAEERGVAVKMGLPTTGAVRPEPVESVAQFSKGVTWKDETFMVRLTLSRNPSTESADGPSSAEEVDQPATEEDEQKTGEETEKKPPELVE